MQQTKKRRSTRPPVHPAASSQRCPPSPAGCDAFPVICDSSCVLYFVSTTLPFSLAPSSLRITCLAPPHAMTTHGIARRLSIPYTKPIHRKNACAKRRTSPLTAPHAFLSSPHTHSLTCVECYTTSRPPLSVLSLPPSPPYSLSLSSSSTLNDAARYKSQHTSNKTHRHETATVNQRKRDNASRHLFVFAPFFFYFALHRDRTLRFPLCLSTLSADPTLDRCARDGPVYPVPRVLSSRGCFFLSLSLIVDPFSLRSHPSSACPLRCIDRHRPVFSVFASFFVWPFLSRAPRRCTRPISSPAPSSVVVGQRLTCASPPPPALSSLALFVASLSPLTVSACAAFTSRRPATGSEGE